MKKVTYFAIFEPVANGSLSAYFPDLPGCITVGKNFDEAMHMAEDVLNLHLYGMDQDGKVIPSPTLPPFEGIGAGCIVAPVSIFPSFSASRLSHLGQRDGRFFGLGVHLCLKNCFEQACPSLKYS